MKSTVSESEIQAWLVSYLVDLLDIESDRVDVQKPLSRYGLDSSATMVLLGDLETWLDCELSANLLKANSTISTVSKQLASIVSGTV